MKNFKKPRNHTGVPANPPVYPDEINKIRTYLETKPRDLMLFDLITQSGVQIKHLLRLKVKDLCGLKVGDKFTFPDLAGKVPDSIVMTENLYKTWQWYLNALKPAESDYIIKSRKGSGSLHLTSASLMIRKWFKAVNLNGQNGIRRLRKVWTPNTTDRSETNRKNARYINRSTTQNLGRVKVKTINESVYQKLFNAVITSKFSPGERLVTHKLAKEMNVSQAPVREALRLLEAQGLMSSPQKKGSFVAELSAENFDEIFKIRIMLESKAIEKAVLNIDSKVLNTLNSLNDEYVEATATNNIIQMIEINKQFHHTIYARANMPMLLTLIKWLWDRMSPYVHLLFSMSDKYYGAGVANHRKILEGIKNQDLKIVSKYLKKDLTDARKQLMKHFHRL